MPDTGLAALLPLLGVVVAGYLWAFGAIWYHSSGKGRRRGYRR